MNRNKIAFQGTFGANSQLACQKFYPEFESESFENFADVFAAVESGKVALGMIPLENSSAGRVSQIHDLLQKHQVFIVAEHFFSVTHNLAAPDGARLEEVREVLSHPQALMQCQKNLQVLGLRAVEFSNTAKAAEFVAVQNDKTKAALCSKAAADLYGLKILRENMQDESDNATLFIAISKNPLRLEEENLPTLTSLIFVIKNFPGSLYKALGCFANNDVGMLQIESFIRGGASKQAVFFVTIEGAVGCEAVDVALSDLAQVAKEVKLLGSYLADKSRF